MKRKILLLLTVCCYFICAPMLIAQSDFGCAIGFFQYLNNADQLTQYNPNTGNFDNVGSTTPANDFHSLGYNVEDDYMYGIDKSTDQLFQLNSDGTATLLGTITGWPGSDNGAFDQSGNFYAQTGGNLYMVDVSGTAPYSYTTIPLSPTPAFLGDIVFNAANGLFYGMNGTTLYAINPTTGVVTSSTITGLSGTVGNSFGGAFTDYESNLFFFNNTNGEIYQIDLVTNTATLAYVSTSSNSNDAASCPLACPPPASAADDIDGDNVINDCDLDDDNDGILDTDECFDTATNTGCDTDGDGLPDYQDLDSDNDGCFDALEGDGGFDYTDLADNFSLENGMNVDTDGIPIVANGGQANISSTDETVQSALCDRCQNPNHIDYIADDQDGDMIVDICDLDDDNDGILDVDEGCPEPTPNNLDIFGTWGPSGTVITLDANNSYTATNINGTGLDIQFTEVQGGGVNGFPRTFTNVTPTIQGATPTNINQTSEIDLTSTVLGHLEYNIEFFETGTNNPVSVCNFTFTMGDVDNSEIYGAFTSSVLLGNIPGHVSQLNNPTTGVYLQSDATGIPNNSNAADVSVTTFGPLNSFGFITEKTTAGQYGIFIKDIQFTLCNCVGIDTDLDGIPDHLDPDSDNDGCPDAIEGGGAFDFPDLVANNSLEDGTNVDADGIPTVAGTGQTVGSSTDPAIQAAECDPCENNNHPNYDPLDTDGDGYEDICDLDDDNDGILDAVECNLVNATFVETSEDLTGLTDIASGTYTFPDGTSGNWDFTTTSPQSQDPANFPISNYNVSGTNIYVLANGSPFYEVTIVLNLSGEPGVVTIGPGNGAVWSFEEFTFSWIGGGYATVSDPNNDLDYADGALISSGTTVTNTLNGNSGAQTYAWEIVFPQGVSQITLTTNQTGNIIENIQYYIQKCPDTDMDGIADYLDPDSDNDGCFDALEGDGGFDYPDLATNNVLENGTNVDADGVPIVANGGQGDVSSTDPNVEAAVCDPCTNPNHPDYNPNLANVGISVSETSANTNDDGLLCAGDAATLDAGAGYDYLWSTTETTQVISVTTSGTYAVTVTDPNTGCTAETDVNITVDEVPIASLNCPSSIIKACEGIFNLMPADTNPLSLPTSVGTFTGSAAPYVIGTGQPGTSTVFNLVSMPKNTLLDLTYTLTSPNGCTHSTSCSFTIQACQASAGDF